MDKLDKDSLQTYIAWGSLSVAFFFSILIIVRNRHNKHGISIVEQQSFKPPKYLNLWSLISLYISPICILIFLSRKIPYICLWTYPFTPFAVVTPKIFLTFFEIARLKLCFASNKIPKELSYPNWLFTILYLIGYLILITYAFYDWLTTTIYKLDNNLCTWDRNKLWSLISSILGVTATIWNWTIILLYIFKLFQLKKRIIGENRQPSNTNHASQSTQDVLQKINLILSKMLFLILIVQITTSVSGFSQVWIGTQWQIVWMIDFMTTISVMYLMLEHNQKDYYMFLGFLIKIGCIKCCCCCLYKLMEIDKIHEINQQNNKDKECNDRDDGSIEGETTTNVLDINDDEKRDTDDINKGMNGTERTSMLTMMNIKFIDTTDIDTRTIEIDIETSTQL